MIYPKEEKQKIDALLTAFQPYIDGHKYFDIAFSNKSGFLFLDLSEDGVILDESVIQGPDDLLTLLFNEVADDARNERICNGDDTVYLYQTEIAALRSLIDPILSSLNYQDKAYCLHTLNQYINQCNTN